MKYAFKPKRVGEWDETMEECVCVCEIEREREREGEMKMDQFRITCSD